MNGEGWMTHSHPRRTRGQWDGTELIEQSGGGYTLTGGFWPVNVDQTDILFRDGFEG